MIDFVPLLAATVPPDRFQTVSLFDPQYLFAQVPQLAAQVRPYFELLAFPILASAGVRGWLTNPQDKLMGIMPVLIAALFTAIIPQSINTADEAVDDLVRKSGLADPYTIATRLYALADKFTPINRGEEANVKRLQQAQGNPEAYAQETVNQYSLWGINLTGTVNFLKKISDGTGQALKVAYDTVKEPMGGIGDWIRGVFFKLIAVVCAAGAWFLLLVCSLIVYGFASVRFLLIHLESIVLPVFIAMAVTHSLRSQGLNFILGLIGIVFWPLGWALGHVGTLAVASWFANMLGALVGLKADGYTLSDGVIFDWVMNGSVTGLPAMTPQSLCCILLVVVGGVLIVGAWVLIVTFSAPFMIARALRNGSGMFGDMAGGSTRTVAALGGGALKMAGASMAAAAMASNAASNNALSSGSNVPASSGGGGGMPAGVNAGNALANRSSAGSVAGLVMTRASPGTAGFYASNSSGKTAFIPLSPAEMQAMMSGRGNHDGGGSGSNGSPASASTNGGLGSSKTGSSPSGVTVTGPSASGYRFAMAAAALSAAAGGVLTSASQWEGSPGGLASGVNSGISSGMDRADHIRRKREGGNRKPAGGTP